MAGVLPQWDVALTLELADEFQRALRPPNWKETLPSLYGNEPGGGAAGNPSSKGSDRLRVVCNALTRLRFCSTRRRQWISPPAAGWVRRLRVSCRGSSVPSRGTSDITRGVGHWARWGFIIRENVIGLDSGCVWGEELTAVKLASRSGRAHVTQVECSNCRAVMGLSGIVGLSRLRHAEPQRFLPIRRLQAEGREQLVI